MTKLGATASLPYSVLMRIASPLLASTLFALSLLAAHASAQDGLRGHGGPVRTLAIAPDGRTAISGGFDQSAIVWDLQAGKALRVLRVHEGAVNAVAALPGGRFLTAGEDGRVALWGSDGARPLRVDKAHEAPIAGLAVSSDGASYSTAGWDNLARTFSLETGIAVEDFAGHRGAVNALAWLGPSLVTASYDATLRIWPTDKTQPPKIVETPAPQNALAVLDNGRIAAGGADGMVLILNESGVILSRTQAAEAPIIALAASPNGRDLAAASPRGSVAIINVGEPGAKVRFTLNGPGLPVWSLSYSPDGRTLLTGGGDKLVRRWDARTGEHIGAVVAQGPGDELSAYAGVRGAEVYRACAICHTLKPGDDNRAGPTLHGVFGRKAGTAPGYDYSDAFRKLDLVWSAETISRLFEIGPQSYTPGTKMPEQRVTDPADRAALIDFLSQATMANKP